MAAGIYDITAEQGGEFKRSIVVLNKTTGNPYNLTGRLLRMHVRPIDNEYRLVELTTENGEIIDYVPANGAFTLYVGATLTETWPPGEYRYDLEAYNSSNSDDVLKLLKGRFTVLGEVTK